MIEQVVRMRRELIASIQVVRVLPIRTSMKAIGEHCQQGAGSCDLRRAHLAMKRVASLAAFAALAALSRSDERAAVRPFMHERCHYLATGGIDGGGGII
jgi:hypothetical protein